MNLSFSWVDRFHNNREVWIKDCWKKNKTGQVIKERWKYFIWKCGWIQISLYKQNMGFPPFNNPHKTHLSVLLFSPHRSNACTLTKSQTLFFNLSSSSSSSSSLLLLLPFCLPFHRLTGSSSSNMETHLKQLHRCIEFLESFRPDSLQQLVRDTVQFRWSCGFYKIKLFGYKRTVTFEFTAS